MESQFPFTKQEDKEAQEAERRIESTARAQGPRSLAQHPRGAFASLMGQCSKCHVQVTVDLRRNGIPNGLIFDFWDRKWNRVSATEYKHIDCGGHLQKFRDCIPAGYGLYEPEWRKRK